MALLGKRQPITLYQVGDLPQGLASAFSDVTQADLSLVQVLRLTTYSTVSMLRTALSRAEMILYRMAFTPTLLKVDSKAPRIVERSKSLLTLSPPRTATTKQT